ncbi:MBL fold metallo-hydrolase [Bacillus sp. SD088]|uniref:MBL fold metallo-hydrolase n=1 Tax=Bacillus sp. SD088 TaxID=2782012 RepID=UPI001A9568A0|nr:MBL fold metallo-hydrolase [Bacillus sp. SD088]MBO0994529.1 adenosylcobinamide kinase [Bacillus sp. SD088]
MKLTFLGTAGPDQIPSPFCDCRTCTYARKHRGYDLRKRCMYLINDDLLVDMGADLFVACSMHEVHLINTKYALVTHSHHDHFDVKNIGLRKLGYHTYEELPVLTFVAPPSVMALLSDSDVRDADVGLKRKPILPFEQIDLYPYSIKALKATHIPSIGDAVTYLIDDGKSKVLIASDTAVYKEEVWPHLEDIELDQLIIECAVGTNTGFKAGQTRHLSVDGVGTMITKMRNINAITERTSIHATHFTHKHCLPHHEMSEVLRPMNVECAYDGLVLQF